jgi:hypothetical protein
MKMVKAVANARISQELATMVDLHLSGEDSPSVSMGGGEDDELGGQGLCSEQPIRHDDTQPKSAMPWSMRAGIEGGRSGSGVRHWAGPPPIGPERILVYSSFVPVGSPKGAQTCSPAIAPARSRASHFHPLAH